MRQLSSLDAQFIAMEDGCVHSHAIGLALYDPSSAPDGALTRTAVRDVVAERLHLLAPFRWRLVEIPLSLDYPYWIDDGAVNLDAHVREIVLAEEPSDAELARPVAEVAEQPLPRDRPLWEIVVIQGLADGQVGVMTKLHHAMIDGVSSAELFSILLDGEPRPTRLRGQSPPAERMPSRPEMLVRGLLGMPRQPWRAVRSVGAIAHLDQVPSLRTLPGVPRVSRVARRLSAGEIDNARLVAPRTRLNDRVSGERSVAFGSIPLADVKAIKARFGVTVNDVALAIVAGGLRTWLLAQGALPERPLVALVPVSERDKDQPSDFGNQVAMIVAELPTDNADGSGRVMQAHDAMRIAKQRFASMPANTLADANNFIAPAIFSPAARLITEITLRNQDEAFANLMVSNIPGPRAELFLAGAQLVAHYPFGVIFHGLGMNVTLMSYRDRLDFGITCDHGLVANAWPIAAAINDAYDELMLLVGDAATTREPAERT